MQKVKADKGSSIKYKALLWPLGEGLYRSQPKVFETGFYKIIDGLITIKISLLSSEQCKHIFS